MTAWYAGQAVTYTVIDNNTLIHFPHHRLHISFTRLYGCSPLGVPEPQVVMVAVQIIVIFTVFTARNTAG